MNPKPLASPALIALGAAAAAGAPLALRRKG